MTMSTATTPLRLGFIGAGGNTRQRHLPGFRALPGVELVAVANRSPDSAARVAAEWDIPHVEADGHALLARDDLDAVCIGTWPDRHAEFTISALAAGKHVLCEARMARTLAEADAMVAAAAARPALVAQLVPSPFTLTFDVAIGACLRDGRVGLLREVVVTHHTAANAGPGPLSWRQDLALSGYNTMALGILFEPLLRWREGEVRVLAADAAVFTLERADAAGRLRPVRTPESLTVLGRWADGVRLTMHLTSVDRGPPRQEYRLSGEAGTLVLDLTAGRLTLTDAAGVTTELPADPAAGWAVEAEFVRSIREGAPVRRTDFATGRRYMAFTEAVWHAWGGPALPADV
jgi:predicted dehydrogenase